MSLEPRVVEVKYRKYEVLADHCRLVSLVAWGMNFGSDPLDACGLWVASGVNLASVVQAVPKLAQS